MDQNKLNEIRDYLLNEESVRFATHTLYWAEDLTEWCLISNDGLREVGYLEHLLDLIPEAELLDYYTEELEEA